MKEPARGLPWLQNPNCNLLLISNKHLCWRNVSHSACFRSTFWWPLQGPEKRPDGSRTGEHTGTVPTMEPFCRSLLFLLTLEFKGKCFSWIQTHTLFSCEALQALFRICSKFSSFWLRLCFVCEYLFGTWVWFQYQTVALKLAYSLQNRGCFFWSWLTFDPFLWKQGFSATVPGFSAFGLFFEKTILWKLSEKAFSLDPLSCFLWIGWDCLASCLNWTICAASCLSCLKQVLFSRGNTSRKSEPNPLI